MKGEWWIGGGEGKGDVKGEREGGGQVEDERKKKTTVKEDGEGAGEGKGGCLLYTSPSPRDSSPSRMPSSA